MTRRLRSRPTVAALLLAALLPLGCGARDATGTASLLAWDCGWTFCKVSGCEGTGLACTGCD